MTTERKTRTVVSCNNKTYWVYFDCNMRAKEYYHTKQKDIKTRRLFFISFESMCMPQQRSLLKYIDCLTEEYIEETLAKNIEKDSTNEKQIRKHFRAVKKRISEYYRLINNIASKTT